MKKTFINLILLATIFNCLAANAAYFKVLDSMGSPVFYGKTKLKDFCSGNVKMQNFSTNETCTGLWFASSNMKNTKNKDIHVYSRVDCTEGKIYEMVISEKFNGNAVDQYKNSYSIININKKEFKKSLKQSGTKFTNENL